MKRYLLDTNICIYLFKKRHHILERMNQVGWENCYISEITLAELYYGASNSGQKEMKMKMKEIHLLEEYLTILPIRPTIEKYGDYKSVLRKQGLLIDDFDLLIGCTAVHNKLIMVTENVKHLSRIPNILIENWIQDK